MLLLHTCLETNVNGDQEKQNANEGGDSLHLS